jgi:hypothetical protein
METRIAELGQQDRVLRSPERQHRPVGKGWRAHPRSSYFDSDVMK